MEAIRRAVRAGRAAVQEAGEDDPLVFARAFLDCDGAQIPGEDAPDRARELGVALLDALGRAVTPADPDVAREVHRARAETRLALALRAPQVVGFLLVLDPDAESDPHCLALLGEDHGLGAAVFPRERVLIAPPWCIDYELVPVRDDEVEQ